MMKRASIAESLGIRLALKNEKELFKWFLVCLLFGKPIQRQVAERAYLALSKANLASPDAVLRAGWDELVRLLDESHYVRFDFSTATKLLHVCQELKERYGSLRELLRQSGTPQEVSRRLQQFKYIGPVTARIFLREVRPVWYPSHTSKKPKQGVSVQAR